ncbi:hypothetical protein ACEZCY_11085 [Streptacidiphilus sp. N1-12]|uniref:Uncharacterized protein n=2 Tax=Streptacidiphilus alkalitolerans TaxID=3342712 RepID=A0ABV6WCS9_9ACTN
MLLTIPLVFAFGLALAFLLRAKTLGFGSAFIAAMFGFYLSATGAAKPINTLMVAAAAALLHLH